MQNRTMITDNKFDFRFSSLIRATMVILSIVLLVFAVMPNFAQDAQRDNNQAGEQAGATRIFRAELRAVLSEILLGDQGQGAVGQDYVDIKPDALSTTDLIKEAALDEYAFVKNAYFEKRKSQINGTAFEDFQEY